MVLNKTKIYSLYIFKNFQLCLKSHIDKIPHDFTSRTSYNFAAETKYYEKPNITKIKRGGYSMVKGINRQVLEIQETGSPYFDRAFFFVKPEFAFTDEKRLRQAAEDALKRPDRLPKTQPKRIKNVLYWALGSGAAVGAGAIITALCVH